MDSTLINIECVDEIADAAGMKAEVAAITEATMRGEIADYKESLRRRVALLRGVPERRCTRLRRAVELNPGAERCVEARKAAGPEDAARLGRLHLLQRPRAANACGIDYTRANVLEIVDGELTGRMVDQDWGDICDGAEKRKMLLETCAALGIDPRRRSPWATAPTTCR